MLTYIYWISYLIIINFIAIIVTAADKRKAQKHLWRIPEHLLIAIAVLGGSPAMLITMYAIHHKTRHKKFMIGIPVIMAVQTLFLYSFLWK